MVFEHVVLMFIQTDLGCTGYSFYSLLQMCVYAIFSSVTSVGSLIKVSSLNLSYNNYNDDDALQ